MADFEAKFQEMQKYLPFLKNVIEKLRSSSEQGDDNPRKAQLKKMEVLHDLLKSNGKKLKMETLLKCEGLLIKLHSKMVRIPLLQNDSETSKATTTNPTTSNTNRDVPSNLSEKMSNVEIVDITGPESPPPQLMEEEPPVEIPTERRGSPTAHGNEKASRSDQQRDRHNKHGSTRHERQHHKHHHDHQQRNSHSSHNPSNSHHQQQHAHGHTHHSSQHERHHHTEHSTANRANDRTPIFNRRSTGGAERLTELTTSSSNNNNKNNNNSNGDKYRTEPQRTRDPRASKDRSHEIYSPEECWDEATNNAQATTATASKAAAQLPAGVTATLVLFNSDPIEPESATKEKAYHDTIFNFNKKQTPKNAQMFSRVRNPEHTAPSPASTVAPSEPMPIPVRVPTIPDVLKSPPLTASDLSELLNESDEQINDQNNIPSIAGIGTRRPGKSNPAEPLKSDAASTLDKVRRKFAIVTQNSPQLRNSPDILKSPIGSIATSAVAAQERALPAERIALKYHPHPRTERHVQPCDPRLNPNRLGHSASVSSSSSAKTIYNSAAPHDPRLRKAAESSAKPSLYQQQTQVSPQAHHSPQQQQPMKVSHIPSVVSGEIIPSRHNTTTLTAGYPNAAMDPRQQMGGGGGSQVFARRDYPAEEDGANAMHSIPTIENQQVVERPVRLQRSKNGYSSEENWDSETEAEVVTKISPARGMPHLAPKGVSSHASPQGAPHLAPKGFTSHVSPQGAPHLAPKGLTSHVSPQGAPYITPRGAPHISPKGAPHVALKGVPPHIAPKDVPQIVPSPPTRPQMVPQPVPPPVAAQNHAYMRSHEAHMENHFRPVKAPLLNTPTGPYGRHPNTAMPTHMHNPHLQQAVHSTTGHMSNPPNQSKFKALLNDITERNKYYESKKQKHNEPRTYMEYKQAKARAAAEEAAAAKLAAEQNKKDIGKVSEVDSSVLAKLAEQTPAATSTLDKLYRSTDFSSSDFPKAKTSFKIPKKHVEKTTADKSESVTSKAAGGKKDGDIKENKSTPGVVTEQQQQQQKKEEAAKKPDGTKENNAETVRTPVTADKKKTEAKEHTAKKDKDEASEKKESNKKHSKENVKKESADVNKNAGEKVTKKPVSKPQDNSESMAVADKTQQAKKDAEAKAEAKTDTICDAESKSDAEGLLEKPEVAATSVEEKKKATLQNQQVVEKPVKPQRSRSGYSSEENWDSEPEADVVTKTSAARCVSLSPTPQGQEETAIQETAPQEAAPQVAAENIHPTTEESNTTSAESSGSPLKSEILKELAESPVKPARILRRRNTMIVRGSVPEVDKEKIFTSKALVYEDIQGAKEEERRKEIDLKIPKINKSLADIFQKTDDNCTVSTQNIISGKRRTRTNINFNEVQRSQEVFRVKRRSEGAAKGTVNKNESASPAAAKSTTNKNESAPPAAKTNTPKGGKKGQKRKINEEEEVGETQKTESVEKAKGGASEVKNDHEAEDENKHAKALETLVKVETDSTSGDIGVKSAKPTSKIDAIMDEDAQKRHLLESFVQDILNPKKDKAQIFSLLSQILSEDNLKFVKEIVESTAEKNAAQNEEANEEAGDEESVAAFNVDPTAPNNNAHMPLDDEDEAKAATSESKASASVAKKTSKAAKGRYKKKNELDRLNEDIRTMFISQGVLTATGRRMCTLVAAAEEATQHATESVAHDELKTRAAMKSAHAPRKELPRLRKVRVCIERINFKEIQKRMRLQRMAKTAKKRANSVEESESELVDVATKKTPPRKMPILKPHTPIKQSEVEDNGSDDDELDESPAAKKIKLDAKIVKKVKPGPKSSKKPNSPNSALSSAKKCGIADSEIVPEKAAKKATPPKNANKEWHSQSKWVKWCMICDTKIPFTTHYKHMHGESYISRLPPDTLAQLKAGKLSKPFFATHQKKQMYWSYRCAFCQQHNRTTQTSWFDHFATHTSEYPFECSKCRRTACKLKKIDIHVKTTCPGASVIRHGNVPMTNVLRGHVCHICNYIQLHRKNLDSHLTTQHHIAKSKVSKFGYTIDLFDTRDVEVVDALKAVEIEVEILNADLQKADGERGTLKGALDEQSNASSSLSSSTAAAIANESENTNASAKGSENTANAIEKESENAKTSAKGNKNANTKRSAKANTSTNAKANVNAKANANAKAKAKANASANAKAKSKQSTHESESNDRDNSDDSTDSDDSDDLPIAMTVQKLSAAAAKAAAKENASTSNVFVPTRESTNESPTMNFAQSLFNSGNEQAQNDSSATAVTTATRSDNAVGSASVGGGKHAASSGISIAERLSQKFKSIKSGKPNAAENVTNAAAVASKPSTTTTRAEGAHTNNVQGKNDGGKTSAETIAPMRSPAVRKRLNSSTDTAFSTSTTTASVATETLSIADQSAVALASAKESALVATPAEDDDENWEDIEITESGPSKTKTSSNAASKQNKARNKNVLHKLNRLYATNNKLKKSLSITISSRKKAMSGERRDSEASRSVCSESSAASTVIEKIGTTACTATTTTTNTTAAATLATTTTNIEHTKECETPVSAPHEPLALLPMHSAESNLGFRPLITNLDDLLPDSPCNDPIELVPDLAPIESLHDLCDVSSILNSDYISNDWQQTIVPLNLNNDSSQHVSMQEALDFVHEQQQQHQQQQQQCGEQNVIASTVTTTTTLANVIAPTGVPSIYRIQNIGFSRSNDDSTFKFYCLSENCTFLYSSEAIGLESHFICEHAQCTWNGYCQSCKSQIEGTTDGNTKLPLSAELKHMRLRHLVSATSRRASAVQATTVVASTTVAIPITVASLSASVSTTASVATRTSVTTSDRTSTATPAPASVLPAAVAELKQPSASNSPAPDDDRPRIKIRRLTGDCLSTTASSTTTLSSKSITTFDENAQLIELSNNVGPTPKTSISTSFLNQVSPAIAAEQTNNAENRHFQNIGHFSPIVEAESTTSAQPPPCTLQITSVVSLKENSMISNSATPPPTSQPQQPTQRSQLQLPVISNVCSLNSRSISSPVSGNSSAGALWAQHIADERAELERSAAESMEVSRILSKTASSRRNSPHTTTERDALNVSSESPEPQVVAETVPVGQSTSGSYLITQTVSAQYEEGRLGFNISIATNPSAAAATATATTPLSRSDSSSSVSNSSTIATTVPQFKCMANGCKYQTRLPLAMGDHLLFHDRQNFSTQREYLRCSQCSHLAEDVDGFLHHTEEKHGMMMRTNPELETGKGADGNDKTKSTNAVARKSLNTEMVQNFTQETWETALKEILSATGVPDSKLFRCTIENCKTKLTESTYYSHVVYHLSTLGQINVNTHTYKCPHCKCAYDKPQKIKTHIKTHGMHKYFCYVCMQTTTNIDQMLKHYEERHWRTKKLRSTPLPYRATDRQNSLYILFSSSINQREVQQFREKLIAEWQRKKSSSRTHFKPSEIGLLPLTPIFGKDLNCAICPYKTKVRTNLMRHLQMHTDDNNGSMQHVANVDPINPVPCLNTNEKHFDKMTNLASSSLVVGASIAATGASATTSTAIDSGIVDGGGAASDSIGISKIIYKYVPETKRYTCGVHNCQYLTISDDIFRSHLNALHSDIATYNCPHCKELICKRGLSVDRIVSHLRFHGPKLYQCAFCGYFHFMRNVVDRHVRQHDANPQPAVIEYIRNAANTAKPTDRAITPAPSAEPQPVNKTDTLSKSKSKHRWSCNLCGIKTATQQQMIAHTTSKHSCKHQYICTHCVFTAPQMAQVMTHIDEKHAFKKREVRFVFQQEIDEEDNDSNSAETPIDTRPLWQRDDPTRVRHIRGILMENEEESERYRKRLRLDENDDDDDEGAEAGVSDETLNSNQFGFLCYYCNMQYENLLDLHEKHWQASNCKKFRAEKPFRFRISTQLKCPHCLSFVGNSYALIDHMKDLHLNKRYLAADPYATTAGLTCGHCDFRGQTLAQLSQHYSRLRHKPFDLKSLSLEQLEKLKTLGTPLTYVQCLTCMELLANRSAFDAHATIVHAATNVNDIKSQILENTLIYACPICYYASQQELSVLRHMIDHYSGFKRCYFCGLPHTTFNGYMQHCYSDHREEIKKFRDIYTFAEISKFLQQLQLIFPNGLTLNLCNLRMTECLHKYGGSKHIKQLYDEIEKTSQQPPIPRLSLGRLFSRKSIEAKLADGSGGGGGGAGAEAASASTAAALQLAGNYVKPFVAPTFNAQKISKRRSTVALGRDDTALTRFATPSPSREISLKLLNGKKRKIQLTFGILPPQFPMENLDSDKMNFASVSDNEISELEMEPYSFYGKQPEAMDLSKIFIKIAAGDTMETRVNIEKFKLLYNIMPRVVITPTDMTKYRKAALVERKTIKPCPASHKIRYA